MHRTTTAILMALSMAGFLAARLTARAQESRQDHATSIRANGSASTCPISMRVRHAFLSQGELAGDERSPKHGHQMAIRRPGMQIHLTLDGGGARRIISANLTIRGNSGEGGILNLTSKTGNGDEAKRTLRTIDIRLEQGDETEADSYFTVKGFTRVISVKLNAVTYADGSTWKMPDAQTCSAVPDALMLIADR